MSGRNHESEPVQIVNGNDIAAELRHSSNAPTETVLVNASLLEEAADHIERLRALINEWVDADDSVDGAYGSRQWDTLGEAQTALRVAGNALRAEVNR